MVEETLDKDKEERLAALAFGGVGKWAKSRAHFPKHCIAGYALGNISEACSRSLYFWTLPLAVSG